MYNKKLKPKLSDIRSQPTPNSHAPVLHEKFDRPSGMPTFFQKYQHIAFTTTYNQKSLS